MCKMVGGEQRPIVELVAFLPNPDDHKHEERNDFGCVVWHTWNGLDKAMETALPKLRDAAGNCPACILAAIRQRGIPVPEVTGFKFSDECKSAWAIVNERQYQESLDSERNARY